MAASTPKVWDVEHESSGQRASVRWCTWLTTRHRYDADGSNGALAIADLDNIFLLVRGAAFTDRVSEQTDGMS